MKKKGLLVVVILCSLSGVFAQDAPWRLAYDQAEAYMGASKLDSAFTLALKARELACQQFGEQDTNCAVSQYLLGMICFYQGKLEQAGGYFQTVNEIWGEAVPHNSPRYAVTVSNLGAVYFKTSQFEKAIGLFQEALIDYSSPQIQDSIEYLKTLQNLATAYNNTGNYQEAEETFLKVLKLKDEWGEKDSSSYTANLNNLASLYQIMGRNEKAKETYEKALSINERILPEDHLHISTNLHNLALVDHNMGLLEEAESLYQRALDIRVKAFPNKMHPEIARTLNNLADIYAQQGRFKEAEPLYLEALEIRDSLLAKNHIDYASSLNSLAFFYAEMGSPQEAESYFKQTIEVYRNNFGDDHPYVAFGQCNLANYYQTLNRYEEAEALYLLANPQQLAQLYRYFPGLSDQEKIAFKSSKLDDSFERLYHFANNYSEPLQQQALATLLNTQGLVLDFSRNTRNIILASGNDALLEQYDQWLSLRRSMARITQSNDQRMVKKFLELESKADSLEDLLERNPLVKETHVKKSQVGWRLLRETLRPGEAIAGFVRYHLPLGLKLGSNVQYAAIVLLYGKEKPNMISLCSEKDLKELLASSPENSGSYIRSPIANRDMYERVWLPMEDLLEGVNTVYISSAGLLHRVSFESLGNTYKNPLIGKYRLRYVSALRDLDRISAPFSEKEGEIASGDPDFGEAFWEEDVLDPSQSLAFAGPDTIRSGYGPLPGTKDEVDLIAGYFMKKNWAVTKVVEDEATETWLKSLAGPNSPKILHLATHGFFRPENDEVEKLGSPHLQNTISKNPLFRSGLLLAGSNSAWSDQTLPADGEDGVLTAYEVVNLDLRNTDLVVLSACETGLGDVVNGEGVFGLQRAFRLAGANAVIMSLWKVPDRETQQLMELFYKYYLGGESKAEALRAAKLKIRKRNPDPYYWAGFVLVE